MLCVSRVKHCHSAIARENGSKLELRAAWKKTGVSLALKIERQIMDVTQLLLCHGERKLPNDEDPVQVGISYLSNRQSLSLFIGCFYPHNKEI